MPHPQDGATQSRTISTIEDKSGQVDTLSIRKTAPTKRQAGAGILAVLGATTLGAAGFVLGGELLDGRVMGPFTLAAFRFAIALAIFSPVARRGGFRWGMAARPAFIRLGIVSVAGYSALMNVSLSMTTASSAAVITALIPAIAAALAVRLLDERLPRRQWAGLLLSVAGALLPPLAGLGFLLSDPRDALGQLTALGASFAFALGAVWGRDAVGRSAAVVVSAASLTAGVVMLLPLAAIELSMGGMPATGAGGRTMMLLLGVAISGLAFPLFNAGLRHVSAGAAAAITNLFPLLAVAMAVLLGQRAGLSHVVGGAVAVLGVLWAQDRRAEPAAGPAAARAAGA